MNRRGLVGQLIPDVDFDNDEDIVAEILHSINVFFRINHKAISIIFIHSITACLFSQFIYHIMIRFY